MHNGWKTELSDGLNADHSSVRIICPFIKQRAAQRLLEWGTPSTFQVITRFSLADFSEKVSDTSALRLLLDAGAHIRGVKHLHAKLYLLGADRVIVTSANLTEAALSRNHEFGFIAKDAQIVGGCNKYFEELWSKAGPDLARERLADWERRIDDHLARGAPPAAASALGDDGVAAGPIAEPAGVPPWVDEATQSFVKFFGEGHNRASRSMQTLDEVERSGSHWACTYPASARPRSVRDGAVMFMGRMVKDPNDTLVFGRAVGMRYRPGRDDATSQDIDKRPWKAQWPRYVRVHHAEFVAGRLANGVSLGELMDALQSDAFASTQRHAREGTGNTNPRRAYMQKPSIELTPEGRAWLNDRLERAFIAHGKLKPVDLNRLDWPATSLET